MIAVSRFALFSLPALLAAAAAGPAFTAEQSPAAGSKSYFEARVAPLLARKCVNCHGPARKESGLDLSNLAAIARGGKSGPLLYAGDAGRSLLYQLVSGLKKPLMPPAAGERLTEEELQVVRTWIERGGAGGGPAGDQWNKDAPHWAFQPLRMPEVPRRSGATTGAVDAFIDASLDQAGLAPGPPAGRRDLIRRASFDLHGLPPSPEEVRRFEADRRPLDAAFADLVDRLLASPRYGERWARHWLDVVRYADTGGGSNDWERPNAWRYRDYVIRSLNQDLPYDRFVLEQVAGDELSPHNPDALAAAGFLRMGPWEHTGMSVAAVTRQQWLDDATNITAVAFLGVTAGCARCHDHKFDPLPTRDYYRLQAAFASTSFAERAGDFTAGEQDADWRREALRWRRKLDRAQAELKAVQLRNAGRGVARPAEKGAAPMASPQDLELERAVRKRVEAYERAVRRFEPRVFSVRTGERNDAVHVLAGGQLQARGEQVRPGVLGLALPPGFSADLPAAAGGRRLALARWIIHPENPLTARVIVNRVWQYHFGAGLAANPGNLGKMGAPPSHPELLDWLASRFRSSGPEGLQWRLKALHRLLMNSRAYRRSSTPTAQAARSDPQGRLLSWFPPRRLQAEELRDSMLFTAGILNPRMYGPPVFPEINADLAAQPRLIMGSIAPAWQPSPQKDQRHRRTIYTYQQRSLMEPLLEVFDTPGSADSCERRNESTAAPQVFALFNSENSRRIALEFALRLQREASTPAAQVQRAFQLTFGRNPEKIELAAALKHFGSMRRRHKMHPPPPEPARRPLVRRLVGEFTGALVEIAEDDRTEEYEPSIHPSRTTPEVRALAELCLVLLNSNEFIFVY